MTECIRWEQTKSKYAELAGRVGTLEARVFEIVKSRSTPEEWRLTSSLSSITPFGSFRADSLDEVKAQAERWLAEFVSSLGAAFPPEPDESAAFRLSEAREVLADWDTWRDDPDGRIYDRERVLADQVRALLAIADEPAKEG